MASSRQRKPSARAEPSAEDKGPWWGKYFEFVFTNRAVKDEACKMDGIVIDRPIHRGCLDEPDSNERFEILWKVDGDYDAINADIMDWQQLKTIITDRFVPTKAVAPMVEHLILPMQERNWHATPQEFQQMTAATVAAAKRWQERVKAQGKLLDQLAKDADGKHQQAKLQQKKTTAAKKAAGAAAAPAGKAAKGKAAAGAAAAGTSAAAGAGSSKAAAAGSSKAAAAKPSKPAPAAAAAAAAPAPVKAKAKAGSSGGAAAAAGGSKKRPAAAVALANTKQKGAAAAAAAAVEQDDDDDEAAAAEQKKKKQKKLVAVKQEQEQSKRQKSDAGAAAAEEVSYKGHTGRMYPAAVACKPRDRRIGTRAYKEGEASGEYPVAAIVDEVSFMLPGAKKKSHLVLPKWEGYELDVNGWEDAASMASLDCYKAWVQQDKPAYYTAVKSAAAANAFIAWQNKA